MKAKDKIYVHVKDNPLAITWSEVKEKGCTNEEYVRKEALLEWAKETYLNENASEIRKVCYKQLIDKLNSM